MVPPSEVSHCSTPLKRFDKLTDELFDNPFLPLLFIGKTVETAGFLLIGEASLEAVGVMASLAVPTTAGWYWFGDNIEEAIDETVKESG